MFEKKKGPIPQEVCTSPVAPKRSPSNKKKGSFSHFFAESKVKDIPAESISGPIIPIDGQPSPILADSFERTAEPVRRARETDACNNYAMFRQENLNVFTRIRTYDFSWRSKSENQSSLLSFENSRAMSAHIVIRKLFGLHYSIYS